MKRKRFGMSEWQQHRVKENIRSTLRFLLTVAVSCVFTLWLEHRHPSTVARILAAPSAVRKLLSLQPQWSPEAVPVHVAAPVTTARTRSLGDHYSRYLDEALPLLRSDADVRMVKIEVPSSVLDFQQSAATAGENALLRLHATSARIPAIAVSKNAREFLTAMRITFIDPTAVPKDRLPKLPILAATWQNEYLLVPDPSGEQSKLFVFSRK
jgi:hypothetical protein